jgi:hypothetical protein
MVIWTEPTDGREAGARRGSGSLSGHEDLDDAAVRVSGAAVGEVRAAESHDPGPARA